MSETSQREIVRQLTENTADIIVAGAEAPAEKLTALAHAHRSLADALNQSSHRPSEVSAIEIKGLQELLTKAIETVKAEMGLNRSSMRATGIKKKVLSAYGTVTVSDTPSR